MHSLEHRVLHIIGIALLLSFGLFAQSDVHFADRMLDSFKNSDFRGDDRPLRIIDTAIRLYERHDRDCRVIKARIEKAFWLDHALRYDEAILILNDVLSTYTEACDSNLLLLTYKGLSSTYLSVQDYEKLDAIYRLSRITFNNRFYERKHYEGIQLNYAIGLAHRGRLSESYRYFRQLSRRDLLSDRGAIVENSLTNLGTICAIRGDIDSALIYYNQALLVANERGNQQSVIALLINLANLQSEKGRYAKSIELLDSSRRMAIAQNDLRRMADIQENLSVVYAKLNDYNRAFYHLDRYINLKDSILNAEKLRAVADIEQRYEAEKRKRIIKKLKARHLNTVLKSSNAERTRNISILSGIILFLAAGGLSYQIQQIRKSRRILEEEKERSDRLLLNILPSDIANELKRTGKSKARRHERVSILFTKFDDFSRLSRTISPDHLVKEIDFCYKSMDEICRKHSLEKIKTIGNSYLAAGGLPSQTDRDSTNVIKAALEIRDFMISRKKDRQSNGLFGFDMRIGVHTGPVVAGVVGSDKFSYDIWGDTVNTAARMETGGAPGKVNISQATYQAISQQGMFEFDYRGKIHAKHKGKVEMYFVDYRT